jgi:predicted amino acid dehydrogenase
MVGVAVVGAVTGIASAVSGGMQEKKKNQAMLNATQVDQRSQLELNMAMAKMKDKTDRLKIYADSIGNVRTAQQNALIQAQIIAQQTSADAEKRNLVIVGIGGGAIAIASVFILKN